MLRIVALLTIVLAACGSEPPLSYSETVTITDLAVTPPDLAGAAVVGLKVITTEAGNPYRVFVADATRQLGHAPMSIGVDDVTISLGAGSAGVTRLGEIYAGEVEVWFDMSETLSYTVAGAEMDAGTSAGPFPLDVVFNGVTEEDYPELLNGSFQVVTFGAGAPGFARIDAEGELQVTVTFAAFE